MPAGPSRYNERSWIKYPWTGRGYTYIFFLRDVRFYSLTVGWFVLGVRTFNLKMTCALSAVLEIFSSLFSSILLDDVGSEQQQIGEFCFWFFFFLPKTDIAASNRRSSFKMMCHRVINMPANNLFDLTIVTVTVRCQSGRPTLSGRYYILILIHVIYLRLALPGKNRWVFGEKHLRHNNIKGHLHQHKRCLRNNRPIMSPVNSV